MGITGAKPAEGFTTTAANNRSRTTTILGYISEERAAKGIESRSLSDQEIIDRYMAAMVNEAALVVEEGIAQRPLDVDVTLLNGYGFPRWRGGPMQYADTVGVDKILNDIKRFAEEDDFLWQPAPLLEKLAAEGKTFASLNA
jgi:3-hydroxyacyl-CoA dehydrogenase